MKILIAAGGTGGHINPGIAIANKIKEKESALLILENCWCVFLRG